jgi:glutaminyl-tRNA synthetase
VSYFPKSPEKGQHFVTLSRNIFVDRSDIRTDDHDDFWGIGPNKTIGLKYCGAFKVLDVIKNGEGVVTEVKLEKLKTEEKPKGFLHWLS